MFLLISGGHIGAPKRYTNYGVSIQVLACVASVSIRVIAQKLEREQKKKWKALVPIFSTNSRGTACYAGYTGAWNVSANNSETVCQKDLRLGHIVYILVFYSISFSWLFPLDGFQFIFSLRDSENDLFPQIFPQKNAQKTARNAQLVPRVFSFSNMASRFHQGEPGGGFPGGGKYIAHFGKEW